MNKLTLYNALDLLRRRDARMIQTNVRDRVEYWLTPSGIRVKDEIAAQIKAHPGIRAGKDGMFPGMDQTWRWAGSRVR
jgi:hypothetical protein